MRELLEHHAFHTAIVIQKPPTTMSLSQEEGKTLDEIQTNNSFIMGDYKKIAHWIVTTERAERSLKPADKTVEAILPTLGIGWTCNAHSLILTEERSGPLYDKALNSLMAATNLLEDDIHRLMNDYVIKNI